MSNLEVGLTQQQMEESGEMEFIRQHLAAAQGEAPAPAPETPEADTVAETEQEPVEEPADSTDEEIPADAGTEPEVESEALTPEGEDILYLELDDETQGLIDTKYGGDINKALTALREGQSLIGRQGSELGDLRRQLEDMRSLIERGQILSQPYPEWPDEYAEPGEAAAGYRAIAEQAFQREDVDTFATAVNAWAAQDSAAANTYRDLKVLQLQTMMAQQAPAVYRDDEATLQAGVDAVKEKYPRFAERDPQFMAAFDAEMQKFPTLRALLWGEIPTSTPEQRLTALEEVVSRVASQQTAETERAARRRVAIRTNEEARQARREARVTSGESARVVEEEPAPRTVPMGQTGRSLNIDRLNAMLAPEDRI